MIIVTNVLHSWVDYLLNFTHLDLLIISTLMLLFALALLRMQRQLAFDRQLREETNRQLLNALQRITYLEDTRPNDVVKPATVEYEINPEELKSRLQSPAGSGNAPDKYRHVASLAQQGMTVTQIAEVLNLSVPEVQQLVVLARIAQRS